MPRIFDNIELDLVKGLIETLNVSERSDFCVGYFNLRGWKKIDSYVEKWEGTKDSCCRVLIGMHRSPEDQARELYSLLKKNGRIDNKEIKRMKLQLAGEFKKQLMTGAPSNDDEKGLQRLSRQIKAKKVVVKLFLKHPLHAKLYLLYRDDFNNPITAYMGSSNLTLAGLAFQGELNVDVLDQDACKKLEKWFNDRWEDRWCVDISEELAEIIDQSWASEYLIPPYHIYLKIAYHLAQEARAGLYEFKLPKDLQNILFDFQVKAVQIAANHVNKRRGVVIGDVVGLGKTMMATALARMFQDDRLFKVLIICPKNLVKMWKSYAYDYDLNAEILPLSMVTRELPNLKRFQLVVIDESHNLRNREGQRFRAIQEYVRENESRVILLTATPYNKTFLDLSSQLRLFIDEQEDIGIRPEQLLKDIGETEFIRRHQAPLRSLAAFEKSEFIDDWRDLMRFYLVRRTRSFIMDNYALEDEDNGRKYLEYPDGTRSYFPNRIPKTLKFTIKENDPNDQYARLYTEDVIDMINDLNLPRYGLGNYLIEEAESGATPQEKVLMENLSRAGKRLKGFCRTNLFKRLESSGKAFILSIGRHIIRNYLYVYAIENRVPLPIGALDAELFDTLTNDEDTDSLLTSQTVLEYSDSDENDVSDENDTAAPEQFTGEWFRDIAEKTYQIYRERYKNKKRFKWIESSLFNEDLKENLLEDAANLIALLKDNSEWDASRDAKLKKLRTLLTKEHPDKKILIFTQFADTVRYLYEELKDIGSIAQVTGQTDDPTEVAYRFSPVSNQKEIAPKDELRVVITTDVLSEGQNLQDCAIVVNFDLPWAIIRLIQRVGRVDRIGQKAEDIFCYSFLPAKGVEEILNLRRRVRQRLVENNEVVGADELFFEDQAESTILNNLYTEQANVLDDDADSDVDLASYAYQIWHNATKDKPSLKKKIENMQDVVFSTKQYSPTSRLPEGVIVYIRTHEGSDGLGYMGQDGKLITESPFTILNLAESTPETPALPRHPKHHDMVKASVDDLLRETKNVGGQLGRPSGARYRTYVRLEKYIAELKSENSLFLTDELLKAHDAMYRAPLRSVAVDILNRQLKSGITDQSLAELVISLYDDERLTLTVEEVDSQEPRILCSMGLFENTEGSE